VQAYALKQSIYKEELIHDKNAKIPVDSQIAK
jgi:hypothetical protein